MKIRLRPCASTVSMSDPRPVMFRPSVTLISPCVMKIVPPASDGSKLIVSVVVSAFASSTASRRLVSPSPASTMSLSVSTVIVARSVRDSRASKIDFRAIACPFSGTRRTRALMN